MNVRTWRGTIDVNVVTAPGKELVKVAVCGVAASSRISEYLGSNKSAVVDAGTGSEPHRSKQGDRNVWLGGLSCASSVISGK